MESYRKDAEQHGALLAFNCEVVGGNISGLSGQQTLVLHLTGLLHARTGMHRHDHVAIVRSGNLPEDSQRQQHLLYAPLQVQRRSRCRCNLLLLSKACSSIEYNYEML